MTKSPLLTVLNDLAYVFECVAMDYLGEGKTMLDVMSTRLESEDPAYDVPGRAALAARLRECTALYRSQERARATSKLERISRELWATVSD
ncbi:MAG TPA: hypothetical protein VFQ84_03705 [Arenimonas sp.]|uniref:hypothetical protein n=1 Tax=Arenimonas sp. TaxID=1872635 RepID=UPI002D7E5E33|nr:hypothetical protein [Arenimonas sp.]HEU0152435.1 hypothetical protein [Arenimonas sp.]